MASGVPGRRLGAYGQVGGAGSGNVAAFVGQACGRGAGERVR